MHEYDIGIQFTTNVLNYRELWLFRLTMD